MLSSTKKCLWPWKSQQKTQKTAWGTLSQKCTCSACWNNTRWQRVWIGLKASFPLGTDRPPKGCALWLQSSEVVLWFWRHERGEVSLVHLLWTQQVSPSPVSHPSSTLAKLPEGWANRATRICSKHLVFPVFKESIEGAWKETFFCSVWKFQQVPGPSCSHWDHQEPLKLLKYSNCFYSNI